MIQIFLLLAYYSTRLQRSEKHLTIFTDMEYGFKKDAQVSLRFSNLTSKIVFGFASKKIINHLKSLNSCLRYCDGQEKISDIQFFINTNDTSFNFTIPSKSFLTPYSISCDEVYKFNIELNILNTKNHLDFRIQAIMIFDLVFFVLFFLIAIISIVYLIFLKSENKISYLIIFSPMSLFIALHPLLSYVYINKKRKQEFFTQSYDFTLNCDFMFVFICIFVFLFAFQLDFHDLLGFKLLYDCQIYFLCVMFLALVIEVAFVFLLSSFVVFLYISIERIFFICIIFISPPYLPFRFVHYFACIIHFYVYVTYCFFIKEDGKAILNCNVVIIRDVTLTVANLLVIITVFLLIMHDNKKHQVRNSYENLEVQIIDNSVHQNIDNPENQNIDNPENQNIDNPENQNIDDSPNQIIDDSPNQIIDDSINQNIDDSENENSDVSGKKIIEHL